MALRKIPSNSTEMRRPASLAGSTNSRRYHPILVSGYSRPSGLAPCPIKVRSLTNGSSTAQSCGRSTLRHAESSNRGAAGPPAEPALAKVPVPRSLPKPKSLSGSLALPSAKRQPKSSSNRSRGAPGRSVAFVAAPTCANAVAAPASRDSRGSATSSPPAITPADAASPAFTKSRRVHFPISRPSERPAISTGTQDFSAHARHPLYPVTACPGQDDFSRRLFSSLLRFQKTAHPVQRPRLAEDNQALQQRRGGRLARQDRPQKHEGVFYRPVLLSAQFLQRRIELFHGERRRLQHAQLFGGEGQSLFQRALLRQEDLRRGHYVILEEEVGHVAKLGQRLDARLHQRRDVAQMLVGKNDVAQCLEEGLGWKCAQVLAVQPLQLGQVEDRPAQRDTLEIELLQHLGERKNIALLDVDAPGNDLLLGWLRHAAAHQPQEVQQRLRQEPALAVIDERDGILALGDFALVQVPQQRHVPKPRQLPAERLVQQHMFGS